LIEPLDAKTGILDQFVDRAVQVTATREMLPGWGEMILPPAHSRLRRAPMLDKEKAPPGLNTRRISCSAVWISGMLHIVHVVTTASTS
jgi:hypothetical protein